MDDTLKCPDCGHPNPRDAASCGNCQFPLTGVPRPPAASADAAPEPEVQPSRRLLRPIRTRRPRPKGDLSVTIWLAVAAFAAVLLVFIAVRANLERASVPVQGSNADQQRQADALRTALAADSTDLRARVGLADLLFDTGNWSEAIVHYRSAVSHDSSLVTAIVDLGVCHYNLGDPIEAERHFRLALAREPKQPFALFNLGIVYERRGDPAGAMRYFHEALQSDPPDNMRQALMDAMQRNQQQSGRSAPPLESAP